MSESFITQHTEYYLGPYKNKDSWQSITTELVSLSILLALQLKKKTNNQKGAEEDTEKRISPPKLLFLVYTVSVSTKVLPLEIFSVNSRSWQTLYYAYLFLRSLSKIQG